MLLDKTAFLEATKLKTEDVEIPGGKVRISELSGTDFLEIYTNPKYKTGDEMDMVKFTPALLACTIVDESGSRIFTNEDVEEIGRRTKDVFLQLAKVAKRLNGLSGEEIKNSEASLSNSSCIDCACTSDIDTPTNSPDSSPQVSLTDGCPTQPLNPSESTEAS